jgi:hypothetical protein
MSIHRDGGYRAEADADTQPSWRVAHAEFGRHEMAHSQLDASFG